MVAISAHIERAAKGVDLPISFTYSTPDGESRAGLSMRAHLAAPNRQTVPADAVTFDPDTGLVTAVWEEGSTEKLAAGCTYEARFVRVRGDATRLFYIRRVQVL